MLFILKQMFIPPLELQSVLGFIIITGINWLDPVIAILVALFIIREAYHLLNKSLYSAS